MQPRGNIFGGNETSKSFFKFWKPNPYFWVTNDAILGYLLDKGSQ